MLKVAFDLLFLRRHAMTDFNFPFWQSALVITLLGIFSGLDPSVGAPNPVVGMVLGLVMIWPVYLLGAQFMGWWLKRKQYWDGVGNLFNLLVAASLIDIVPAILVILGIPYLFTLPLWLYSLLVAGNAIKGATNSGLGYAVGGLILWVVIYLPVIVILSVVASLLGLIQMPGV
ncbi:MAG: hypothetical protein Q8O04_12555 [Deltaproteobacteria bacterium]|nr:hypothetical protein [Deltaproteobacteria bacterium]